MADSPISWTFEFQNRFDEIIFSQYQGELAGNHDLRFLVEEICDEMVMSDNFIRANTMVKDVTVSGNVFRVMLHFVR